MQENWIIPCSLKFYDVVNHFEKHDTIFWRRVSAIHNGDNVYIYVGAPYSEIKYLCHVIDEKVDDKILEINPYAIPSYVKGRKCKFMKLALDHKYESGFFTLNELREHGLGQVQTQARTDRRLQSYINQKIIDFGHE